MSHTTIMHVYPGEKVEYGEELKNSWGSAPYIWDYMGNKYVMNFSMFRDESMNNLWQMWKKKIVPLHQRAVLFMTFDRVYVSKKDYARAAKDIRLFLQDHNDASVVNHWHHIAEIFESNPDVPAIGFYMTSVSNNPFTGGWDEEKEDYLPLNWDDCHDVYSQIDGLGI